MSNILLDIGLIMIVATTIGALARLMKQPLIPAYIIAGILLGPALGLITDPQTVTLLAEIGIAFLLFIVGMELDLRRLKEIGAIATIGGAVQIILLFILGFLTALFLRFELIASIYVGIILAFSSTMVVIKILGDRNELDTLHGRIIIGFLLMQDIFAIIALTVLNRVGGADVSMIGTLSIGVGLLILAFFLGKFVFPNVFQWAARVPELLFLLAISTCMAFALLFTLGGFSIVIGAFVAGIILGNLPFNVEIISRVTPLKDFFSVLFFAAIGLQLEFVYASNIIMPLIILLIFTIVVLPILTIAICSLFGYKRRTAFLAGISLAQISEFSLIIVTQGKKLGHVTNEVYSLTIILTIITIALTSYLIKYEQPLYKFFARYLKIFEQISKVNRELENISDDHKHDVILVGYDRTGYSIFRTLRKLKKDFVVVDFDPDTIKRLMEDGVPCIYGDIGDVEILDKIKLGQAKLVISTIPHHSDTLLLIQKVKSKNPHTHLIVSSSTATDALELYDAGADYVIVPHYLGGDHVSLMLEDITDDLDKLIQTKIDHIRELHHRREHHSKHNRGKKI